MKSIPSKRFLGKINTCTNQKQISQYKCVTIHDNVTQVLLNERLHINQSELKITFGLSK